MTATTLESSHGLADAELRVEGGEKITDRAKYTTDLTLEDELGARLNEYRPVVVH